MCLARSSLAVGEDGTVIALNCPVYHRIDLAVLVEIFLGGLLREEVVEVEGALGRVLFDVDFLLILVVGEAGVLIAVLDLRGQEGSNPDGCFDLACHINFISND